MTSYNDDDYWSELNLRFVVEMGWKTWHCKIIKLSLAEMILFQDKIQSEVNDQVFEKSIHSFRIMIITYYCPFHSIGYERRKNVSAIVRKGGLKNVPHYERLVEIDGH